MKNKIKPILVLLLGLVVIGVGVFILINYTNGYVKTTATITGIFYDYSSTNNDHGIVSYYVGDTLLENINCGWYAANMYIGKQVDILYKVSNPVECKQAFPMIAYVVMAIGAFIALFSIGSFNKNKQVEKFEEKRSKDPNYDENHKENFFDDYFLKKDDENKMYSFKMGKDYKLVDSNKSEVAIMKHKSGGFFKPTVYDLINKVSNKSIELTANNVVSVSNSNEGYGTLSSAHFIIDGIDCWEYLNRLGFELVDNLTQNPSYQVVDGDKNVVCVIAMNSFANIFSEGMFKIQTNEYYASLALLVAFIVYRTMNSSTNNTSWHVTR